MFDPSFNLAMIYVCISSFLTIKFEFMLGNFEFMLSTYVTSYCSINEVDSINDFENMFVNNIYVNFIYVKKY